jgi:hypothetical protein
MDYECICANLRSLDDPPPPPPPPKPVKKRKFYTRIVDVEGQLVNIPIQEASEDPCQAVGTIRLEPRNATANGDFRGQKAVEPEAEDVKVEVTEVTEENTADQMERPEEMKTSEENSSTNELNGTNGTVLPDSLKQPYISQFAICVEESCSHQEQLQAPGHILAFCHAFAVPVNFPEVMIPFYKRQAAGSSFSGSFFSGGGLSTFAPPSSFSSAAITPATSARTTSTEITTTTSNKQNETRVSSPTSASTGNNTSSGEISSGAKIGIGVAIPLIVVLISIGVFWYFRQRGKKRVTSELLGQNEDGSRLPEPTSEISELKGSGGTKYPMGRQAVEASSVSINEMGDTTSEARLKVYELPNRTMGVASPPSSPAPLSKKPVSPRTTPVAVVSGESVSKASTFPAPWDHAGGDDMTPSNPRLVSREAEPVPKFQKSPGTGGSASPLYSSQAVASSAAGIGDDELQKLEKEMAQVKQRKERLQEVQELERKEEELQRTIEEKRKTMGALGSGGNSGDVGGTTPLRY